MGPRWVATGREAAVGRGGGDAMVGAMAETEAGFVASAGLAASMGLVVLTFMAADAAGAGHFAAMGVWACARRRLAHRFFSEVSTMTSNVQQ